MILEKDYKLSKNNFPVKIKSQALISGFYSV